MEEKPSITFADCSYLHIRDLLARLRLRYDLNPDTNEDYRQFLIAEGVLPADYTPNGKADQ